MSGPRNPDAKREDNRHPPGRRPQQQGQPIGVGAANPAQQPAGGQPVQAQPPNLPAAAPGLPPQNPPGQGQPAAPQQPPNLPIPPPVQPAPHPVQPQQPAGDPQARVANGLAATIRGIILENPGGLYNQQVELFAAVNADPENLDRVLAALQALYLQGQGGNIPVELGVTEQELQGLANLNGTNLAAAKVEAATQLRKIVAGDASNVIYNDANFFQNGDRGIVRRINLLKALANPNYDNPGERAAILQAIQTAYPHWNVTQAMHGNDLAGNDVNLQMGRANKDAIIGLALIHLPQAMQDPSFFATNPAEKTALVAALNSNSGDVNYHKKVALALKAAYKGNAAAQIPELGGITCAQLEAMSDAFFAQAAGNIRPLGLAVQNAKAITQQPDFLRRNIAHHLAGAIAAPNFLDNKRIKKLEFLATLNVANPNDPDQRQRIFRALRESYPDDGTPIAELGGITGNQLHHLGSVNFQDADINAQITAAKAAATGTPLLQQRLAAFHLGSAVENIRIPFDPNGHGAALLTALDVEDHTAPAASARILTELKAAYGATAGDNTPIPELGGITKGQLHNLQALTDPVLRADMEYLRGAARYRKFIDRDDVKAMSHLSAVLEDPGVKNALIEHFTNNDNTPPANLDRLLTAVNEAANRAGANEIANEIARRLAPNNRNVLDEIERATTRGAAAATQSQLLGEARFMQFINRPEIKDELPSLQQLLKVQAVRAALIAHWGNSPNTPPTDVKALRDALATSATATDMQTKLTAALGMPANSLDAAMGADDRANTLAGENVNSLRGEARVQNLLLDPKSKDILDSAPTLREDIVALRAPLSEHYGNLAKTPTPPDSKVVSNLRNKMIEAKSVQEARTAFNQLTPDASAAAAPNTFYDLAGARADIVDARIRDIRDVTARREEGRHSRAVTDSALAKRECKARFKKIKAFKTDASSEDALRGVYNRGLTASVENLLAVLDSTHELHAPLTKLKAALAGADDSAKENALKEAKKVCDELWKDSGKLHSVKINSFLSRDILASYKKLAERYRNDAELYIHSLAAEDKDKPNEIQEKCRKDIAALDLYRGYLLTNLSNFTNPDHRDQLKQVEAKIAEMDQLISTLEATIAYIEKAKTENLAHPQVNCFSDESKVVADTPEAIERQIRDFTQNASAPLTPSGHIAARAIGDSRINKSDVFGAGNVRVNKTTHHEEAGSFDVVSVQKGSRVDLYYNQEDMRNASLASKVKTAEIEFKNLISGLGSKKGVTFEVGGPMDPEVAKIIVIIGKMHGYEITSAVPLPKVGFFSTEKGFENDVKKILAGNKPAIHPHAKTLGEDPKELAKLEKKVSPTHRLGRGSSGG